jgi:hypothetical protein
MEGSLVAYKVFTNGSVLQASEVNDNLMNQAVISFANSSARTAAIPSPIEGMTTYMTDSDTIQIYDGTNWKTSLATTGSILQVVQGVKTDVFSASLASGGITTITGLSATITPKSTTSKILVSYDISGGGPFGFGVILRRAGTAIGLGAGEGSRTRVTSGAWADDNRRLGNATGQVLDSPETASAVTYDLQMINLDSGTATLFFNRSLFDENAANGVRSASRITLLEVSA